jgi:hypothetical protein
MRVKYNRVFIRCRTMTILIGSSRHIKTTMYARCFKIYYYAGEIIIYLNVWDQSIHFCCANLGGSPLQVCSEVRSVSIRIQHWRPGATFRIKHANSDVEFVWFANGINHRMGPCANQGERSIG